MRLIPCLVTATLWALASMPAGHAETPLQLRIFTAYETLDWQLQLPNPHRYLLGNLMLGLFQLDSHMKLVPAQAEKYTVDDDALVYTIRLKSGLKWSDGVRVTAEDYIRSWSRARQAPAKFGLGWLFTDIHDFKAINPTTIRIRLKQPNSQLLNQLALPAMFPLRPEHLRTGFKTAGFPVTGPYLLSEWNRKDGTFTLSKNRNYPDPNLGPNSVTLRVVPANDDGRAAFEKGLIDVLPGVDADTLSVLDSMKSARYTPFDFWYLDYLVFNLHSSAARSKDLRAAISLAIDTTELARLLNSGQRPGTSFILKGMIGYSGPKAVVDLVRAKARIAAWREGSSANRSRAIRILYYDTKTSRKIAAVLAKMLREKLELRVESRFSTLDMYPQLLGAGDFDAAIYYINPDSPLPDQYLGRFEGQNQRNVGHYESAVYLAAMNSLNLTAPSRRGPIYENLESLLIEKDFVVRPLTEGVMPTLISQRVSQISISPLNLLWLPDVRMKP